MLSLRISVVTPSLNQGRYLDEAIRSVLDQQYPDFEHFVVDGGSSDQTRDVLGRYPHLRWISEPDAGQTAAINKGLRMSAGDIFAYLNADDLYRPGAFRTVAEVFQADPTTAAVVGDCDAIDEASRLHGRYRARLDSFEDLLRYWQWGTRFCIPQPAVFIRRDLLDEVGPFDEHYDLAMDYQMWLRLAARHPFTLVPRTLAAFRVTGQTKTSRRRPAMEWEQFRASSAYWRLARGRERWLIPCQAVVQSALRALYPSRARRQGT